MIDGLLRQPEGPADPPAHLDDDEGRRRSRVHSDEVQLVPADVDVARQDRPAGRDEVLRDEGLSGIAGALRRRPTGFRRIIHPCDRDAGPYPATYPGRLATLC